MMVFTTSNGYGNVDTSAEEWQLGRKLYEAQLWLTRAERGEVVCTPDSLKIAHWFCELVAHVGELRADYSTLKYCLMQPDRYKFVNDGPYIPITERMELESGDTKVRE